MGFYRNALVQPLAYRPADGFGASTGSGNLADAGAVMPGAAHDAEPSSGADQGYNLFPSDGPYAIDRAPDLSKGEGIQPLVTGMNGKGYSPQDGDRELLARIMFAESGISPDDYPAIGWTVVNRVGERQFRPTLQGVIEQANGNVKQFDGYRSQQWDNAIDPSSLTGPDSLSYSRALQTAGDILSGKIPDPISGANFFHAGTTPSPYFQSRIDSGRFVLVPIGKKSSFYRDMQR